MVPRLRNTSLPSAVHRLRDSLSPVGARFPCVGLAPDGNLGRLPASSVDRVGWPNLLTTTFYGKALHSCAGAYCQRYGRLVISIPLSL